MQLSYASELAPLDDRTAFRGFYQNSPSYAATIESLNSMMRYFRWKRIALFTEDELLFTRVRYNIYYMHGYMSSHYANMHKRIKHDFNFSLHFRN